ALAALAEARGRTLDEVAVSYIVGFEVSCRVAETIVWDHYAKGWHATATIGMLGSTAACAHLLGLTASQTTNALGIAVSHVSGTLENFGTMSKALQAGQCAAVGLRSGVLAALGFTASRTAIDGKQGFTALYADFRDIGASLDKLASGPRAILEDGIDIKKYPSCYAAHRALDGLLDLRKEHGLTIEAVDRVNVRASNRAFLPLIYSRPRTGLEAKFSMQYAVAAALLDGEVRLSSFDDAAVMRARIQDFLPRVSASEAEGPSTPRWTEVEVVLKDGRRLHRRVDRLRGSAKSPLSDAELLEKVGDCLAFGGAKVSAAEIGDLVLNSRNLPLPELFRRFY
ncbi:MAG: MmgE/PrpD family protein, partial [Betaproteobacteria bacterium]|nr:MmgE/PrpD family protein [Betaproteobacteria bacterium]